MLQGWMSALACCQHSRFSVSGLLVTWEPRPRPGTYLRPRRRPFPTGPPGLFCSGNFGFETIARGRGIKLALEGAVERRIGFVTDLTSNLRDTTVGGREELCPQLQPPTCQVG